MGQGYILARSDKDELDQSLFCIGPEVLSPEGFLLRQVAIFDVKKNMLGVAVTWPSKKVRRCPACLVAYKNGEKLELNDGDPVVANDYVCEFMSPLHPACRHRSPDLPIALSPKLLLKEATS